MMLRWWDACVRPSGACQEVSKSENCVALLLRCGGSNPWGIPQVRLDARSSSCVVNDSPGVCGALVRGALVRGALVRGALVRASFSFFCETWLCVRVWLCESGCASV